MKQSYELVIIGNVNEGNQYQFSYSDLIGRGFLGNIYKGIQFDINSESNEKVAIKIYKVESIINDPQLIQQMLGEIETLKTKKNQKIVKILDIIQSNSYIYIVNEYLEFTNLKDFIENAPNFTEQQAILIIKQILQALSELHSINIIHRNLKPRNILIDDSHNVKLADYAFSKIIIDFDKRSLNSPYSIYIAPEIHQNTNNFSHKSDIWSIGILYYYLLFGKAPEIDFKNNTTTKLNSPTPIKLQYPTIQITEESKHFLNQCLYLNPELRASVIDLLKLPLFVSISNVIPSSQNQQNTKQSPEYLLYTSYLEDNLIPETKLSPIIEDQLKEFNLDENSSSQQQQYTNDLDQHLQPFQHADHFDQIFIGPPPQTQINSNQESENSIYPETFVTPQKFKQPNDEQIYLKANSQLNNNQNPEYIQNKFQQIQSADTENIHYINPKSSQNGLSQKTIHVQEVPIIQNSQNQKFFNDSNSQFILQKNIFSNTQETSSQIFDKTAEQNKQFQIINDIHLNKMPLNFLANSQQNQNQKVSQIKKNFQLQIDIDMQKVFDSKYPFSNLQKAINLQKNSHNKSHSLQIVRPQQLYFNRNFPTPTSKVNNNNNSYITLNQSQNFNLSVSFPNQRQYHSFHLEQKFNQSNQSIRFKDTPIMKQSTEQQFQEPKSQRLYPQTCRQHKEIHFLKFQQQSPGKKIFIFNNLIENTKSIYKNTIIRSKSFQLTTPKQSFYQSNLNMSSLIPKQQLKQSQIYFKNQDLKIQFNQAPPTFKKQANPYTKNYKKHNIDPLQQLQQNDKKIKLQPHKQTAKNIDVQKKITNKKNNFNKKSPQQQQNNNKPVQPLQQNKFVQQFYQQSQPYLQPIQQIYIQQNIQNNYPVMQQQYYLPNKYQYHNIIHTTPKHHQIHSYNNYSQGQYQHQQPVIYQQKNQNLVPQILNQFKKKH